VIPGRLSVSRTFGDCQAKLERYGGNPNVIVVDPEIYNIKI
jgi:protein phosphatase 2C family protein 2/3